MMRNGGEGRGSFFFDEREKWWEAGDECVCSATSALTGEWAGRPLDNRRDAGATSFVCATAFEALVKAFLKFCYVDVEAENLCREGVLFGEVFCAPDSPLPGSDGHWGIMGLGAAASKSSGELLPRRGGADALVRPGSGMVLDAFLPLLPGRGRPGLH